MYHVNARDLPGNDVSRTFEGGKHGPCTVSFFLVNNRPGEGPNLHRHAYDETFIICEGHYDFRLDGKLLKLGPGDVVFVPRGTPHGFASTGPEVGRQIIISSPGGIFDALIAEVTMLDTGSPTRQGSEEAKAIAAKYGLEFLPS